MNKTIENSILYLTENFIDPITNSDISNFVNLSEFHFQRLFKQETGLTPQKYLEKTTDDVWVLKINKGKIEKKIVGEYSTEKFNLLLE